MANSKKWKESPKYEMKTNKRTIDCKINLAIYAIDIVQMNVTINKKKPLCEWHYSETDTSWV